MSDSHFHPLTSTADWTDALEQSEETPVLVFKHSSACPVSSQANSEMAELAEEANVPVYKVVVQQNRSVSDDIEAALDVRHETPQAILLHEQTPVFDTSHFNVTEESLRKELRQVNSSSN